MSLAVGKKLGVFEISTLLGVGGMGEVYRARDTKLGREVAIKVLPEEFANDRDRLARFQREARLLAALNHPNIAHIHDLLEADGQHFLVMELVEGETLADRISNGPLPLENVLKVFGQIAEGLEAAHQQGVIHRDLKPANIKITDDGKVSVLDFGLAKAAETQPSATNDGVTSPWDDHSAGRSSVGQIVGTPAYMSPEQARGKPVDKRTDIWAFGCCLYEALTGHRSFRGETVSDTLVKILTADPGWEKLPNRTPPRLRELIESCLAKDVRERLHDIADARIEIGRIASNPGMASTPSAPPAGAIVVRRSRLVAGTTAGLLAASLAGAAIWNAVRPAAPPNQPLKIQQGVVRFTIDLPPDKAIDIDPAVPRFFSGVSQFSLSPDGSRLVYVGGTGDEARLYLRSMDKSEPSELKGTEGARSPFFSPDSQRVGFYARRRLMKVRLDESQPIKVCDAQNVNGASWGRDGMIYFAESPSNGALVNSGLMCVRDSGGIPKLITHTNDDLTAIGHVGPCVLPGGKSVLFTRYGYLSTESSIAVLTLDTGKSKTVVPRGSFARYVPTGHLLFYDQGWFYAARFDTDRPEHIGQPARIVQSGFLPAVSDTGCLVHGPPFPGESREGQPVDRSLVWVDRHGGLQRLNVPKGPYADLQLSPDGDRLAVECRGERGAYISIYDLKFKRENPERLTSGGVNSFPVWMRDGKRVIFSSSRDGKLYALYSAPVDGSANPQPLTDSASRRFPYSVSHDGRTLAFSQIAPSEGFDIYTLQLNDPGRAERLIQSEFYESSPAFSPDGHWLAYVSDETETRVKEVFVMPFPPNPTYPRKQISHSGGGKPLWSHKGDELFYRNGSRLYRVQFETEPPSKAGDSALLKPLKPTEPERLFDIRFGDSPVRRGYDISPDGERFLFMELTDEEAAQGPVDKLFVVQNWFEELERLVPPEGAGEK